MGGGYDVGLRYGRIGVFSVALRIHTHHVPKPQSVVLVSQFSGREYLYALNRCVDGDQRIVLHKIFYFHG